jgi:uncharacterized protein YcbX
MSVKMYPCGPRIGENIDRQFVLYDPKTLEVVRTKDGGVKELFYIAARIGGGALILDMYDPSSPDKWPCMKRDYDVIRDRSEPDVFVNEFGENTPLWDMGDRAAWRISDFCHTDVRLGQKTTEWLSAPASVAKDRKLAPLHVVSLQSLQHLGELILGHLPDADEVLMLTEQVRAGMVIDLAEDEYEAGAEWPDFEWGTGTKFVDDSGNTIGDIVPCKRCEVPGKLPLTGAKSPLFIPGQYRQMPKVDHTKSNGEPTQKSVLGVYATPNPANGVSFAVEVGQELKLVG